jgi:hypothetical protein
MFLPIKIIVLPACWLLAKSKRRLPPKDADLLSLILTLFAQLASATIGLVAEIVEKASTLSAPPLLVG